MDGLLAGDAGDACVETTGLRAGRCGYEDRPDGRRLSIRRSSYCAGGRRAVMVANRMERLGDRDLEGMLRFLHEASSESGPEPFPAHVLLRLRELVGSEWISYCELDRPRRRTLSLTEVPVPDFDMPDDVDATFWRVVEHHPLCCAQQEGRFDARKLSDYCSRRELHRLEIYADWFRPSGIEYELEVGIPSPLEHTKTFLFDDSRRDFGERDRSLLNMLQPHLAELYRAAEVRRVAASACAVLEDGRDLRDHGVLLVGPHGTVDAASPNARRLLAAYAGRRSGARLPAVVARWLEERTAATLRIDGPAGTLLVDLDRRGDADVILLTERAVPQGDAATLSAREREVLALVAEGLRNSEIAEALWVSPATVRKHLENIYEKLGVHTRTGAVARVHGLDR
jgi:DNA-binding CsgD family transcriptional regulator